MHVNYKKANRLTGRLIRAAMEVHTDKGPGLVETIYEWCMTREMDLNSLRWVSQKKVDIHYKGAVRREPLRFDLLVEGCVLMELKAVADIKPIHKAQLLSYMKLLDVPLGLLINFNVEHLRDGVHRLMLPGANLPDPPKE